MRFGSTLCRFGVALLLSPLMACGEETAESLLARARAVLAPTDGELRAVGLREPVEVLRDRWGVPHIYAQNRDDLFFAQGFVAAQDRLFQIDLWRRIGLGETAELFGEEAIEADRFARLIQYRGELAAEWASYSPDAEAIAVAFTQGINACIDRFGPQLPIEFQTLGYAPTKWKPADILGRMSGIIMVSNWQREVARARLIAEVGLERARLMAPTDPPRDFAPAADLDLSAMTPDIFRGYAASTKAWSFTPSTTQSNNWVVDGALSASGKPLLASDPHRAIALPSLRYIVHLHAPGWDVIGSGEPALPGVALGHNAHVAWGFTIVGTDQSDLYLEETHPDDPRRYRVGDRWEPMRIVHETLRVRGQSEPVPIELRFTRHGPVIYQDESRGRAVALKWVGSEPGGAAYLHSLAIDRAESARALRDALGAWAVPSLNFVFADVSGDIGWMAAARTPIRRGWDGLLPVPGARGEYEWQGYLPAEKLPQAFNPSQHWLGTANHNILPPGYQESIAYEWSAPYRYQRVAARLTGQSRFTLEDFQSIQQDVTSIPAGILTNVLRSVTLPADLQPYATLFAEWDGVLSAESQAGALYAVWMQELTTEFFTDRLPQAARMERGDLRSLTLLLNQLAAPQSAYFGTDPDRQRDDLVRLTFARAVLRTRQLLGED
ncbi:MAG TPA: penicillin acylase family protein, partial [Planctomycetaceae bacterium]|nr:penicillin acylase family protein [Planctomycetaceae bacterium]